MAKQGFLHGYLINEFILQVEHTYQSLTQPIAEATALKKKIDMFVVVVDSVARFCRQGQVPVQEFTEYRAKFNDRAKYESIKFKIGIEIIIRIYRQIRLTNNCCSIPLLQIHRGELDTR